MARNILHAGRHRDYPEKKDSGADRRTYLYAADRDTRFTLFRAETLSQAGIMFSQMFAGFGFTPETDQILHDLLSNTNIVMIILSIVLSVDWLPRIRGRIGSLSVEKQVLWTSVSYAAVFILFIYDILNLSQATFNPFIYFQF